MRGRKRNTSPGAHESNKVVAKYGFNAGEDAVRVFENLRHLLSFYGEPDESGCCKPDLKKIGKARQRLAAITGEKFAKASIDKDLISREISDLKDELVGRFSEALRKTDGEFFRDLANLLSTPLIEKESPREYLLRITGASIAGKQTRFFTKTQTLGLLNANGITVSDRHLTTVMKELGLLFKRSPVRVK